MKYSELLFLLFFCYHGIVFHSVISLLQILQLQLGDKVLRDASTLCSNGVQQSVMTKNLLVKQLKSKRGSLQLTKSANYFKLQLNDSSLF